MKHWLGISESQPQKCTQMQFIVMPNKPALSEVNRRSHIFLLCSCCCCYYFCWLVDLPDKTIYHWTSLLACCIMWSGLVVNWTRAFLFRRFFPSTLYRQLGFRGRQKDEAKRLAFFFTLHKNVNTGIYDIKSTSTNGVGTVFFLLAVSIVWSARTGNRFHITNTHLQAT